MRRNVRCHADGDTVRTVHEKIRISCGQNDGLHSRIVEVRIKIDGLLIDLAKHFERHFAHSRLGITISGGRIAVDGTEVSVPVHKGHIDGEILRETNERVVDGAVAVRMIFTEHVADDGSALFIRFVRREPEFVHGI